MTMRWGRSRYCTTNLPYLNTFWYTFIAFDLLSEGSSMTSTYTMHCPACGAANRIPADKEGVRGRCGACKSLLPALYSRPLALDDAGFDSFVNSYELPVLAEFWAPW